MGRKCCAPGCRFNYDNAKNYVTVFKFPSDPERHSLWIRSLNRDNFTPSPYAVVCIKHFEDRFIIKEDKVKRNDGSLLVVPRKKFTLTSDAYPTIFQNLPTYLTKSLPSQRKLPDQRRKEVAERDEQVFIQWYSKERADVNYLDTKIFIEFISKWWKIMNVKHPKKDEHINDEISYPIKTMQDDN